MTSISRRYIRALNTIRYENLPAEVIEKAKLCLIHELGCCCIGCRTEWFNAALGLVRTMKAYPQAAVWFSNHATSAAEAAFVNAVSAQSILHEDIHRVSNAHPGIIVISSVLSLGQQVHCSGKTLIEAIVAGYELMCRLGRSTANSLFGARGFRPTSVIGIFGSAAGSGKLLGLDENQMVNACGFAGNFACGINQWAHEGSHDLYFQNGMAARNGLVAACLAQSGAKAPEGIFEGHAGFCNAFSVSEEVLKQQNPDDGAYEILQIQFKPAPACALVQTTAQLALDIAAAGIDASHIRHVELRTFSLGKQYAGCDFTGPFENVLQARMSNQYNFAAALVRKEIVNLNYENFTNEEVQELTEKISIEIDPHIDSCFPRMQPVQALVTMKDGTVRNFKREEPVYLGEKEVREKFFEHCEGVIRKGLAYEILHTVQNLEKLKDVYELVKLLSV